MFLSLHSPEELMERLRVYCFNTRQTKKQVVNEAIKKYLDEMENKK